MRALALLVLAGVAAPRIARAQDAPAPAPTPAPAPAKPSADDDPDNEPPGFDPTEGPRHDDDDDDETARTGNPITGTGRAGVYVDSDHTTVWRGLATAGKVWDSWSLNGSVAVDAVTSASIDVRSSPALSAVDVVTSASGRSSTSGGQMTDQRYQVTSTGGWKDGNGHSASLTGAFATENDYTSASGGLNGSLDVLDRTTTLLGGVTLTDNWISSVIDPTLHHKMMAVGWSGGVARVLTPDDAVRLRYDGRLADGYQASPYRNVRFGDWTTNTNTYGQIMFEHTIGSADGLPEHLPEVRVSHALTAEWVHSLATGVGLHPSLRLGRDDWGIESITPAIDLRIARHGWRLQVGYRFYAQTAASFFHGRYTEDPTMYTSYTSDKELGRQIGHAGELELSTTLFGADGPHDTNTDLFLRVDVFHYSYPGFPLLGARTGAFFEAGLTWE